MLAAGGTSDVVAVVARQLRIHGDGAVDNYTHNALMKPFTGIFSMSAEVASLPRTVT